MPAHSFAFPHDVLIVVPAYQEGPRLGAMLGSLPQGVRVVVVDDASTDDTSSVAHRAGAAVVRHPRNRGVGAAICTGYQYWLSQKGHPSDALVVMAGDGQMDPGDLPALLSPLATGADYVKGCRFTHRDIGEMPLGRRLGGELFSRATSWAIGQPVRDTQCGYTAITRDACAKLDLEALWGGYGYPNDLLSQLAVRGLVIEEVDVRPVYDGAPSHLKLRHLPRIAWLIGRARLRRTYPPKATSRAGHDQGSPQHRTLS